MYETIRENLLRIQEEIAPCKPKIIAVTKYFDENAIIASYNAGLRNFGESKVVEASKKIEALPQDIKQNSTFHLIGHLQTNKVKQAVKVFDYIHSVDSLKVAQAISNQAQQIGKVQKILVQINNANEEQKFGFSCDDVFKYFEQILQLKNIEVTGVMNMAPLGIDKDVIFELFMQIVQIRNSLQNEFKCELKEISMGMSQDYLLAARAGATMLRIGRKLYSGGKSGGSNSRQF